MYTPASSKVTVATVRAPEGDTTYLVPVMTTSPNLHSTVGSGSAQNVHKNVTVVPAATTRSLGYSVILGGAVVLEFSRWQNVNI